MRAMTTLACCAAAALALAAGCTDFSPAQPEPGSALHIRVLDLAAEEVSTGRVTLRLDVTVGNGGAPSGNLTLRAKAYDLGSTLLGAADSIGHPALPTDGQAMVQLRLTVARDRDHRILVEVLDGDRLAQQAEMSISNLAALEPTTHATGLRIDAIDVQVLDVADGRVRVRATVYVTNLEDDGSAPLRLQVKGREVSTSLVADEVWADVPAVGAEETRRLAVEMLLPDDFNYRVEASLWDGDFEVERGEGFVQFLPQRVQDPQQELVVSDPDLRIFRPGGVDFYTGKVDAVGLVDYEFDRTRAFEGGDAAGDGAPSPTPRSKAQPGPGLVALVAVLGAGAVAWRRWKA